MYISRLRLQNVRCLKDVNLSFNLKGGRLPWTMIVGDNASGKSALLRSLALGLCDESSAAGLLKEFEEGYIRRGAEEAIIDIDLRPNPGSPKKYNIKTTIKKISTKDGLHEHEQVEQKTIPKEDEFPWQKIFVCGYGAARGTAGTGDVAGYSVTNAVYNMFNYSEGLQNPELAIRRIAGKSRRLFDILNDIMLLPKKNSIDLSPTGVTVGGPWGSKMPLRDLADGYKSTFLWVTDLYGWALSHNPQIRSSKEVAGIVLVDELEQHLHAKWKKEILLKLRKHFPKVQFITSTHSPIVASTVGQLAQETDHDQMVLLELGEDASTNARIIPPQKGLWVEQMLASELFLYVTGFDSETESILAEASNLASKGEKRSAEEEQRYNILKKAIGGVLQPQGTTPIEREITSERRRKMREEIDKLEKELFEY